MENGRDRRRSEALQADPAARLAHLAGNVLLVIGAIALVWAFVIWRWGDPVTGLYTRWEQHKLESRLTVVERHFKPQPAPASPTPDPAALARARTTANLAARRLAALVREGDPLGRIRVPRLGLNMIFVDGTDHDSLVRGPGVDRRTSLPGERQLMYIAGHRTTYGAPFAHIDRMRRGDQVELDMPYGQVRLPGHALGDRAGGRRRAAPHPRSRRGCPPGMSSALFGPPALHRVRTARVRDDQLTASRPSC